MVLLLALACLSAAALAEGEDVRRILVEEFNLPDDEKLTRFIEAYEIDEAALSGLNIYFLYDEFYVDPWQAEYEAMQALLSSDSDDRALNPGALCRILLFVNSEANIRLVYIDLNTLQVFAGDGEALHDLDAAQMTILPEDAPLAIRMQLDWAGVSAWEADYPAEGRNGTAWFLWKLALMDSEGRVKCSGGMTLPRGEMGERIEAAMATLMEYAVFPEEK